jgi:hypothetical protein
MKQIIREPRASDEVTLMTGILENIVTIGIKAKASLSRGKDNVASLEKVDNVR